MVTSAQLRAARSLLKWSVRGLADRANVHRNTVSRAEGQDDGHGFAVAQMVRTFEAAGIEFTSDDGATGVRLRKASEA